MGGNAIKKVETHRLAAREYHALVPQVLSEISSVLGSDRPVVEIPAYRSKPEFGDMDVLTVSDGIREDYRTETGRVLGSRDVFPNGGMTSYERQGFQIDLITVPEESFQYALAYFAWNDLGTLVGRVASKMGMKHGFLGLYLPLRDDHHVLAEIKVTQNIDYALEFLGYDPERFRQGFDTLEDIYRYVASSRYFNPEIYLLENRNARSRRRDNKRPTYNGFLKWLDDPNGMAAFRAEQGLPPDRFFQFDEDVTVWQAPLRARFPDLGPQIDEALTRTERKNAAKVIFNREKVAELTGLNGKELGEFIRSMKEGHSGNGDDFTDWVIRAGHEGVKDEILALMGDGQPNSKS